MLIVMLVESITHRWSAIILCIIYYIIHVSSQQIALSFTTKTDDIEFSRFLYKSKIFFILLSFALIIILVVFVLIVL